VSAGFRQLMTFSFIYYDVLVATSMSCKLSAVILLAMFCFLRIAPVLYKYANCHFELNGVTYSKSFN